MSTSNGNSIRITPLLAAQMAAISTVVGGMVAIAVPPETMLAVLAGIWVVSVLIAVLLRVIPE